MKFAIVGAVSEDQIYLPEQTVPTRSPGGGVFFASLAASTILQELQPSSSSDAAVTVVTVCPPEKEPLFAPLLTTSPPRLEVYTIAAPAATSCVNRYVQHGRPDLRIQQMAARAPPFEMETVWPLLPPDVGCILITALWHGEAPEDLVRGLHRVFPRARLAVDAQGFVREIGENGEIMPQDWSRKKEILPMLQYFKVDNKELNLLVPDQSGAMEEQMRTLQTWGNGVVVIGTANDGVHLMDEKGAVHFAPWDASMVTMEGRTGRGDTCTAAVLIAREQMPDWDWDRVASYAATVTSKKMARAGPYGYPFGQ